MKNGFKNACACLRVTALEKTSPVFVGAWARLNTIDPDTLYRLVGPYIDAGK
jgi:hypothetical protein